MKVQNLKCIKLKNFAFYIVIFHFDICILH